MRLLRCADSGVLVELDGLDEVLELYAELSEGLPPGVTELVPAARTLLLRLAPGGVSLSAVEAVVVAAMERARSGQRVLAATGAGISASGTASPAGELLKIPVVYDGPDLAEVGVLTGLGTAGVIDAHTGGEWTVAFCGFAPGFGYLTSGDDTRLAVSRRATSRTRVPAGAVGLAGEFSGIYPRESPGGWQLIGHTSLRIFDLDREPPAMLRPGVRVRFTQASR